MWMISSKSVNISRRDSRKDEIIEKILSFAYLDSGWHFGEGKPATNREIESAIRIVSYLREAGSSSMESFPEIAGGVLVAGHGADGSSIEVLCRADGLFDIWIEKEDHEVESSQLGIGETIELIEENSWYHQSLSGFFTQNITIGPRGDTTGLHSKIRPQVEYRSSTSTAQTIEAGAYAITSPHIIHQKQRDRLRFSGG